MGKSKKNNRISRKYKRTRLTRKKQSGCSQKIWNKNGCAHHKYSESTCPLCRKQMQNGGKLGGKLGGLKNRSKKNKQGGGSCGRCMAQHGGRGGFYGAASPIPGPFIGRAWEGNVEGWPGVNGIGSDRNYLAQNLYHVDPQRMMLLGGKKNKKNKKGGGLIPQGLVNLGRDLTYNMGSAYNALNGYNPPVNPAPYVQMPKSNTIII